MTSLPDLPRLRGRKKITDQTPLTKQIGRTLRALREAHNYSQEDIATRLGVSYQQVQKYESGKNRVSLEGLLILKELYNIDYEMLFYGVEGSPEDALKRNSGDLNILIKLTRLEDRTLKRKIEQVVDILCDH